jgi:hypothetical protein
LASFRDRLLGLAALALPGDATLEPQSLELSERIRSEKELVQHIEANPTGEGLVFLAWVAGQLEIEGAVDPLTRLLEDSRAPDEVRGESAIRSRPYRRTWNF